MSKPTLVMVHGLIGSLDYFDPAARIPYARVETIDLLGYGEFRAVKPDRLSLAAQARHVADFIDRLDTGAVWLLGHSMGGAVAVLLADQHPASVAGIINVEGNFTLEDAFWSARIIQRSPRQWAQDYRKMLNDPSAWLRRCGVCPTEIRNTWGRAILDHQPPATVRAMARAIIDHEADLLETAGSPFLPRFEELLEFENPLLEAARGGQFAEPEPCLVMERLGGQDDRLTAAVRGRGRRLRGPRHRVLPQFRHGRLRDRERHDGPSGRLRERRRRLGSGGGVRGGPG